jgi:PilZ domain
MPTQSDDRRRFPRIPSISTLLVSRVGDKDSEALSKTHTIGAGGCMFVHNATLGVGAVVELTMMVHGQVLKARGRVAWENVKGPGWVEVGVEFIEVAPEDRPALAKLLAEDFPA